MNKAAFTALKASIEAGELTPDQMEDMVMAIDHTYKTHHPSIYRQMPTSLRDVADEMVLAREDLEFIGRLEGQANEARKCGYVHTVPNVEGVSLGVAA